MSLAEADALFKRLNLELYENIESHYFFDPKEFRSLVDVLEVLGDRMDVPSVGKNETMTDALRKINPHFTRLLNQKKIVDDIIEDVVKFQHGGLNNSVDTLTDAIKEYSNGRQEIRYLRSSLLETKSVLTARKTGQLSMKELWSRKKELEETIRIMKMLGQLKESPVLCQKLLSQKMFLSAVKQLNDSISLMFCEDLVSVQGITTIRDQLMELKETCLESIIAELKSDILATESILKMFDREEEDDDISDKRSDSTLNLSPEDILRRDNKNTLDSANLDLKSLTADVEAQFRTGASSGLLNSDTLGIRLLVKAVGEFNCEEDVGRLLLESVTGEFHLVIKSQREWAFDRFSRIANSTDRSSHQVGKYFSEFITVMLQSSLQILRRMFYVLRLLGYSVHSKNFPNEEFSFEIKEHIRRGVLGLWNEIERGISNELKIHFVENDIEVISDTKSKLVVPDASIDNEDERSDAVAIFPSSVRLVAPVYRSVMEYCKTTNEILAPFLSSNKPIQVTGKKSLTIMEAMQMNKAMELPPSEILTTIQEILETEFIPIVQSSVNQDMREIQLHSNYFTLQSKPSTALSSVRDGVPVSTAGQIILNASQPLFLYWLQLPEHSDMVITIYDRLIRGFCSSAKEELENQAWKLLSYDDSYKNPMIKWMKKTSAYQQYRESMFGGSDSLESLLGMSSDEAFGHVVDKSEIIASLIDDSNWKNIWNVSTSNYPISSEKIASDLSVLTNIGAIANSCDWLIINLSRACSSITKKIHYSKPRNSRSSAHRSSRKSRNEISSSNRQMSDEAYLSMLSTTLGGLKELMRLSDECLGILLCESQMASFFYLHHLAYVRLSPNSADIDNIQDAETNIMSWSQHILSILSSLRISVPMSVIPVIFSSLPIAVPRMLTNFLRNVLMAVNRSVSSNLAPQVLQSIQSQHKSRLLKVVVATQQCLTLLLQSTKLSADEVNSFNENQGVEFDRLRKFVSMTELGIPELKSYIRSNTNQFSRSEYLALWNFAILRTDRSYSFDEYWKSLSSTN